MQLRLSLLLTAVLLIQSATSGVSASDDESSRRDGAERERVYSVPVRPAEGTGFEVRRVVVEVGDRRFAVSADAGIVRESQDRIRLRGVPVIGKVFMDRLSEADFTPDKAVGDVYVEESTLWVEFAPEYHVDRLGPVVIVHDKFSYRFQGQPSDVVVEKTARDRVVGRAYARDGALLILVRPSIITDSLL